MTDRIYFSGDQEQLLEDWKKNVRGVVEASSFEMHALWQEFSKEYAEMHPDFVDPRFLSYRVDWKLGPGGFLKTIKGKDFDTTISLFVNELDGKLCLFWTRTSMKCDWEAAEIWIRENFRNIVVDKYGRRAYSDAMNFHNVISVIKTMD